MRFQILFLCANTLFAQARYDLLLKGGHVIDPKNKISEVRDVAIRDGRDRCGGARYPGQHRPAKWWMSRACTSRPG